MAAYREVRRRMCLASMSVSRGPRSASLSNRCLAPAFQNTVPCCWPLTDTARTRESADRPQGFSSAVSVSVGCAGVVGVGDCSLAEESPWGGGVVRAARREKAISMASSHMVTGEVTTAFCVFVRGGNGGGRRGREP